MDAVLILSPECFAVALSRPVRVKVSDRRPAPFLILREDGTGRSVVFRTKLHHRELTPILDRIDEIDRVRAWPVLGEMLAIYTPKPRPVRKGAPIDAAAEID